MWALLLPHETVCDLNPVHQPGVSDLLRRFSSGGLSVNFFGATGHWLLREKLASLSAGLQYPRWWGPRLSEACSVNHRIGVIYGEVEETGQFAFNSKMPSLLVKTLIRLHPSGVENGRGSPTRVTGRGPIEAVSSRRSRRRSPLCNNAYDDTRP